MQIRRRSSRLCPRIINQETMWQLPQFLLLLLCKSKKCQVLQLHIAACWLLFRGHKSLKRSKGARLQHAADTNTHPTTRANTWSPDVCNNCQVGSNIRGCCSMIYALHFRWLAEFIVFIAQGMRPTSFPNRRLGLFLVIAYQVNTIISCLSGECFTLCQLVKRWCFNKFPARVKAK